MGGRFDAAHVILGEFISTYRRRLRAKPFYAAPKSFCMHFSNLMFYSSSTTSRAERRPCHIWNNAGQKNLIFMIDAGGFAAFSWFQMAGVEIQFALLSPTQTAPNLELPPSHCFPRSLQTPSSRPPDTRACSYILSAIVNRP
jgi:hypothetical protein